MIYISKNMYTTFTKMLQNTVIIKTTLEKSRLHESSWVTNLICINNIVFYRYRLEKTHVISIIHFFRTVWHCFRIENKFEKTIQSHLVQYFQNLDLMKWNDMVQNFFCGFRFFEILHSQKKGCTIKIIKKLKNAFML